ncbi:CENP-S associating centromere protein X-domain-containing protein [Biscogniauxia mediterranea]|nr:CENP-S associating centromere protein X-domain-containing protein [Biscogniauxia mediterranea]
MPPKGSSTAARGRGTSAAGRPSKQSQSAGSSSRNKSTSQAPRNTGSSKSHNDEDPFADDDPPPRKRQSQDMEIDEDGGEEEEEEEDESETQKTIPPELLTRILHEFFEKDSTRISKDANAAVAKYMDIFVREAIARTAVEKESGFLEVEDLEKVAPQLLLDL